MSHYSIRLGRGTELRRESRDFTGRGVQKTHKAEEG